MNYLKTEDGSKIYYRTSGKGHPLVCIHGFGADSTAFRLTEKILSKDFLVVTLDLRGHGNTVIGNEDISFSAMAKDIEMLLEHLNLGKITLLGWSMGGTVAMEYIKRFGKDRLENLILVETSPKAISDDKWKYGLLRGNFTREMAKEELLSIKDDFRGFVDMFINKMAPELDSENLKIAIEAMKRNDPGHMIRIWENIISADYRDVLRGFDRPCLVISGKESTFYGVESGQFLTGMMKKGIHHSISGGHLAPIESPVEFNRVVKDFIDLKS
ncbi:MAG: alpha/beta fold hydrolase [Bacillota bacterium]